MAEKTDHEKGRSAGKEFKPATDVLGILNEALVPGTLPTEGKSKEFLKGFQEGQKEKKK